MALRMRRVVASMFHRRLLLLTVVICVCFAALGAQLANLTIAQASLRRAEAESVMAETTLVPTVRGQIIDAKGRILAIDRPTYDVSVHYPVLSGQWVFRRAWRDAYRANRERWAQLSRDEREELVAQSEAPYQTQVEALWTMLCDFTGKTREQLEERKAAIHERIQQTTGHVWLRQRERREAELEDEDVSLSDVAKEIEEQRDYHTLLSDIDAAAQLRIQRLISDAAQKATERDADGKPVKYDGDVWRLVRIEPSKQRDYPLAEMTVTIDRSTLPGPIRSDTPAQIKITGLATHIVGAMRKAWYEDTERRPFVKRVRGQEPVIDLGGYVSGDRVGAWGVEKSCEDRLRGMRGRLIEQLDTHAQESQPAVQGQAVKLAMDAALQARVQAIMDPDLGLMKVQPWNSKDPSADPLRPQMGSALYGAAVVLEVSTCNVLAAVSTPSLSLQELRDNPEAILGDELRRPYLNRAFSQPFQPGSTVKPIVLASAITERKLGVGEPITCTGHLEPNDPVHFRCWIYKQTNGARTHGPLPADEAIARSCNIFFYTLGKRLGPQPLVSWYRKFGLGQPTGVGLDEEARGDLPNLARAGEPGVRGFESADGVFMAIGQGPITWTPIQAAAAYATLARGGYYITPTLLASAEDTPRRSQDLGLDPRGVELALKGLDGAINQSYGTGHFLHLPGGVNEPTFNVPAVRVIGKSGTADAAPLRIKNADDREAIALEGDHAWMITLVRGESARAPQYVVVVVVEYGGSGGAVAGPVANQIIHALKAEGYL